MSAFVASGGASHVVAGVTFTTGSMTAGPGVVVAAERPTWSGVFDCGDVGCAIVADDSCVVGCPSICECFYASYSAPTRVVSNPSAMGHVEAGPFHTAWIASGPGLMVHGSVHGSAGVLGSSGVSAGGWAVRLSLTW